jgi:hypothetical protein
MTNRRLLVVLSGAVVVAGVAGCGASGTGTPGAPPAASATVAHSPADSAQSPCDTLGGTSDPDGTCHVHSETPTYTLDFRFPVSYPDMQPVTDFIAHKRDEFIDWLKKYPVPNSISSALNIVGTSYESSGTKSLVLDIGTEGGVHPVTTYKAFNYDVQKRAPITFDTMFKPGDAPLAVLNPIAQQELDKREATDISAADAGLDTYQNFAITDDSLIFFINQDGAFPHYVGSLRITVPRSELGPLLAGSGSVAPCGSGQVTVTAAPPQAAAGHRAVTLTFGLAPGAGACTLAGYPGVDTGAGGPLVHAQRLPRGYMGGLAEGSDEPPVVTVSPTESAHAIVEGLAVDENGNQCPTYTDLRVTPPDTTETSTVPTTIDVCMLIEHPVIA